MRVQNVALNNGPEVAGVRITEVKVREPSAGELRGLSIGAIATMDVAGGGGAGRDAAPLPDRAEDAMADVALVFHWPLSELCAMSARELADWRARAAERFAPPAGRG